MEGSESLPIIQATSTMDSTIQATEAATACAICFSNFNKGIRKQVTCQFCATSICRGCAQQLLLHQALTPTCRSLSEARGPIGSCFTATCPSTECGLPWSDEFLDENMTATFRNGVLAEHKKKYLLDREKVRLPQFQDRARLVKEINERCEVLCNEYSAEEEKYCNDPILIEKRRLCDKIDKLNVEYASMVYGGVWNTYPELTRAYQNGIFSRSYLPRSDVTPEMIQAVRDSLTDDRSRKLFDCAIDNTANYRQTDTENTEHHRINKDEIFRLEEQIHELYAKRRLAITVRYYVLDNYGKPYIYNDDNQVYYNNEYDDEYEDGDLPQPGIAAAIEIAARLGEGSLILVGADQAAQKATTVHCGCPVDGCKGFIGNGWKCGLCGVKVCQTCRECVAASEATSETCGEAGEQHICDKERVETIHLLMRETKPCPTCAALIYKTDGCDQMWCTQCRTAFSWHTGQKEKGRIHNPHYYEWVRRTQGSVPREPGDGPRDACAEDGLREFTYNELLNRAAKRARISREAFFADVDKHYHCEAVDLLRAFWNLLAEVRQYKANRGAVDQVERDRVTSLEDYAVSYLVGFCDEKAWGYDILEAEKKAAFEVALFQVYDMFYNAGRDIYNSISEESPIGQALKQLVTLRSFAIKELEKIYKRFGETVKFDDLLKIVPSNCMQPESSVFSLIPDDMRHENMTSRWMNVYLSHLLA